MALEMRLEQRQVQRLILSPQMQQAIYLLQLPLMELKVIVEQEMTENPVLDEEKDQEQEGDAETEIREDGSEADTPSDDDDNVLSSLDESWRENLEQDVYIPPNRSPKESSEIHNFLETLITKDVSLEEHLMSQLRLQDLDENQFRIGENIIGNLNDDGYLVVSIDEVAKTTGSSHEDVELVLSMIQLLDPAGIAARDLQECLQVQLISMGRQDHLAYQILAKPIGLVERKRYSELSKMLDASIKDVQKAVDFISKLEPKPGRKFTSNTTIYVVPDVIIQKVDDEYIILTNDTDLPRLRINKFYKSLIKDKTRDKETRDYIKGKVQSAMWLIKNIKQRQKTIYRITDEIIKAQRDFLDNGISHLKPLTLKHIAEQLNLNLSTISRAVMNKYIQTPQGTFAIRKLFSISLPTEDGTTSSAHVQQRISDLIAGENPKKPISDQKITDTLKKEGILIARRTVAKYREDRLKIPSSSMRKKY